MCPILYMIRLHRLTVTLEIKHLAQVLMLQPVRCMNQAVLNHGLAGTLSSASRTPN